jgi:hypothetical protein
MGFPLRKWTLTAYTLDPGLEALCPDRLIVESTWMTSSA